LARLNWSVVRAVTAADKNMALAESKLLIGNW
jgi:hypothetical protein